ncbi:MAG TPA: DUF6519 domain-containing protein [Anaerolineae bacterium]|nr:DUF6519 domain-containing protein [Anaerolineae bacterium]
MKGDFTRDTFDATKHFTRVLMQQGRVQLDADGNEQVSILLHYLQALAEDLIGPYGGPVKIVQGSEWLENQGFKMDPILSSGTLTDLGVGAGRYYVDGVLCENDQDSCTYFAQDDFPREREEDQLPKDPFLVYLDVWERLMTYREDDDIREVALGGPDTAGRAKVVWQIKVEEDLPAGMPGAGANDAAWRTWITNHWSDWMKNWQPQNRGLLTAQAKEDQQQNTDACAVPPEARYLGMENQLYRVEIHKGGKIEDRPTFKWSRENGSVCFSILKTDSARIYLEHLGRDARFSLKKDDWVEIVDDTLVLSGQAGLLLQVDEVDPLDMVVTLRVSTGTQLPVYNEQATTHPLLRRWESGDVPLVEDDPLDLESGIVIQFHSAEGNEPAPSYRTGDYWLIPARTATGDVEWPGPVGAPETRPPHGVNHHYAPLAVVVGVTAHDVRTRFSITLT